MQNLSKEKLLFSHGTIIVSTFILIVILLIGMKTIESNIVKLQEGPTTSTFYVGDIRFGLVANQRAINRVIAVGESVLAEEEAKMEENMKLVTDAHDVLVTTLMTAEDQATLDDIWSLIEKEEVYRAELIKLFETGDFEGANAYDESTYTPLVDQIRAEADELDQSIFQTGEDYKNTSVMTAYIMIAIGVALLILVTAIVVQLATKATKSLVEPIQEVEAASKRLYAGDMSASKDITYVSEDEVGSLAEALRGSMDTLDGWVEEISGTLAEIAGGDLTKDFNEITDFISNTVQCSSFRRKLSDC